jgi:dienelactone hydrolase
VQAVAPRALPDVAAAGAAVRRGPDLPGYAQFFLASDGMAHVVYHAGVRTRSPVLVLPELAGFAPGYLMFAERLVAAGFQVYLPWLVGPFGRRAPIRNALRLCVSQEFARLRAGVSAPVTVWLRALISHISDYSGQGRVGAIGMCMTGAFAIPMILHPKVSVAIAAQPAVPLSWPFVVLGCGGVAQRRALNVAQTDLASARVRLSAGDARLLAVRCAADRLCPVDKMERLQAEFPEGLTVKTYGDAQSRNGVGERPHATYTKEYRLAPPQDVDHPSRRAFEDLVSFLREGLCAPGE